MARLASTSNSLQRRSWKSGFGLRTLPHVSGLSTLNRVLTAFSASTNASYSSIGIFAVWRIHSAWPVFPFHSPAGIAYESASNPAPRSDADVEAMWEGVIDGSVNTIDDVVEKLKTFAEGPDVNKTGWIFGMGYVAGGAIALLALHKLWRILTGSITDAELIGVGEQRRVVHRQHRGVPRQPLGDALGVLALAVHSERDGGQAAVQHPALVGLEDIAEHDPHFAQLAHEGGIAGQRHPGQHVAEAREVLGGGVEHQVGAQHQRVLEGRAEESVVHHHPRASPVG